MKFRKKPIVIEAIQYQGEDSLSFMQKAWGDIFKRQVKITPGFLHVFTLEGLMLARVGDYIIKGVKGEFYPCRPDIFETTYEIYPCRPDIFETTYEIVTENE